VKHQKIVGLFAAMSIAVYLGVSWMAYAEPPAHGAKPFRPVQPLKMLMQGQNTLHDEIKTAIADKNFKDGERLSWVLAEIANVNQYQRENPAYQTLADQMSHQCVEMAQSLHNKDEKGAKEHFAEVGKTCGACHDQFAKKGKRRR